MATFSTLSETLASWGETFNPEYQRLKDKRWQCTLKCSRSSVFFSILHLLTHGVNRFIVGPLSPDVHRGVGDAPTKKLALELAAEDLKAKLPGERKCF